MLRLVLFLIAVLMIATGLSWLAERPGTIDIEWEGYRGSLSVFHAVVILALLVALATVVWAILRQIWTSPAALGQFLNRRRQQRGLDALSSGMIAVGAGDRSGAMRYALQARKSLPNEPLTHLLRAQAAQLTGDKATARRIFEAMLSSPDTEPLGLRGLYLEAMRVQEVEAARQFAERAMQLNPKLSWPVEALFDLQCKASDWGGALETLAVARKNGHIEKPAADRRRAVLLTAQAQALEDTEAERALNLALEAHGLAPSLIPAAAIAGRILASRGNTPRAAKVLQKTWSRAPHPDLALAYAYARIGDSPRDRVDRVKQLAALAPMSIESPIAVATTAIEAKDYAEARRSLAGLTDGRLTQRVATLMARVEGEEHGDKGKVREWLARAVNAPRDPAWTADGIVSERWAAISPVTGTLDAFQWRVPVDDLQAVEGADLATRLESLVTLGAPAEAAEHATIEGVAGQGEAAGTAELASGPPAAASKRSSAADRREVRSDDKHDNSQPRVAPRNTADLPLVDSERPAAEPDIELQDDAPARPEASVRQRAAPEEVVSAELVPGPGPVPAAIAGPAAEAVATHPKAASDVAGEAAEPSSENAAASARETPQGGSKKSSPKAAASAEPKSRRRPESVAPVAAAARMEIFVSPRAPDDPGPEGDEDIESTTTRTRPPYAT